MPQRFSERIGARPVRDSLQIGSMDDDLRNRLWSVVYELVFKPKAECHLSSSSESVRNFFVKLDLDFFKLPTDELADWVPYNIERIKKWFFGSDWYLIYDFLEFLAKHAPPWWVDRVGFKKGCNIILGEEMSGYRFIGDQIGPITDGTEIDAMEEALADTDISRWSPIYKHLEAAKGMLFKRPKADFRNSIKESISAVEAAASILAGKQKAKLGAALTALERQGSLHPSLKEAFQKLYAYTSDADGIRHALLEGDSSCDFEDAKYMLVTCSAFVHYLIAKTADR